jgi:DNA replication protein DnaC
MDDLCAARPTEWVQEQLFLIIDHRLRNQKRTAFSCDAPRDVVATYINPRIADRLFDVGSDEVTVVLMQAPSFRTGKWWVTK